MAAFTTSQYGKFASFQNNSGSADAAAPNGGVYLFASGALGSSKLYLQNEGESSLIDLDSVLDFAGDSGTGTISNSQTLTIAGGTGLDTTASGQTLTFSMDLNELSAAAVAVGADSIAIIDADDNGSKKESIADLATAMAGDGLAASSGVFAVGVDDSSIELNSDALRVKAAGITNAMLADDAVDSDELAAGAVDLAHMSANSVDSDQYVDGSIDLVHMSANSVDSDQYVDGSIDTAHIADDQITNALMADDAIDSAQIADGAVDLAHMSDNSVDSDQYVDGSIDTAHLADNQVTLAKMAGLADAKFILGDSNGDPAAVTMSGDATMDNAGALTIAANAVQTGMVHDDVATELAGDGLAASSGVLAVQASGSVVVASDKLGLSGSLAGTGLTYTGGVNSIATLALDIDELGALGGTGVAQGDHFLFSDAGTEKKITFSNLEDAIFGNVSGDATVAAGGALTIAANAVQTGMVHDDVATELAGNGLSAASGVLAVGVDDSSLEIDSDALRVKASGITSAMIADGAVVNADINASAAIVATKLNFNVDLGGNVQFGTQTDDVVAFGGPIKVGGNVIANAEGESTISMDNDQNVALAAAATVGGGYGATGITLSSAGAIQANGGATIDGALSVGGGYGSTGASLSAAGSLQLNGGLTVDDAATFGGGYGSTGVTISNAGVVQMDGALTQGADGAGADAKFHGGDANEYMLYDASHNHLQFQNASSALILEIGASTNGYALEVAQLAGDAGKIKATAFVTYSDETLKEEVTAMDNALDAVMSLNGVEFTWKNSGERDFGFLAQEVKSVIPQAVSVGSDGIHGVDYSRLTSVLVEAVKAQQVQIDDLKKALKK